MTTTVWQGTIHPRTVTVTVGFRFSDPGGTPYETVAADNYVSDINGASGYPDLTGLGGDPIVLESTSSTTDTGSDFNSAWSDAAVPPLQLDPSKTYTVTITTDD